jgi:Methyltransferase domain
VTITACSRAAAVQRGLPAPDPLAKASARQRSNVATLIPTSRETKSIAELSGGNSRATIRSLYACPYRATFCYPRPQRFRPYLGGNFSDTEGLFIHDSLHTTENVLFELRRVWPHVRAGGAVVVDDVDINDGFRIFVAETAHARSWVCEAEPIRPDDRRSNNKGMFGIILKQAI